MARLVSLFAWALICFLAPLGVAAAGLYLRRTMQGDPKLTRTRLTLEIVTGAIFAIAYLFMLAVTSGDVGIYDKDPSCRQTANFSDATASGACTTLNATVTGVVGSRGQRVRDQTPYLEIFVSTEDGRSLSTGVPYFTSGYYVWRTANAHPRTPARVQLFRNRVTLIKIDGASGPTDDLPWQSLSHKVAWIAFGSGLVLAGLLEIALAPMVLEPGE